MRRRFIALLCSMLLSCVFATTAFGATFDPGSVSATSSLVSTEVGQSHHNYFKVTTSGSKMTIKGETPMAMPSNGGRLSFNAQVVDPNG